MVLKFGFFTATVNGGKNFELVAVSSSIVYEVSITAVAVAVLPLNPSWPVIVTVGGDTYPSPGFVTVIAVTAPPDTVAVAWAVIFDCVEAESNPPEKDTVADV